MKKIFADRVTQRDYANRFAPFTACRSELARVLNFGIGQDTDLVEEADKRLLENFFGDSAAYGYSEGECPELLQSFASFAYRNYGVSLAPENLAISMGIKEALNTLAYLLIDRGDLVVTTAPGYAVFPRACRNYGARVIEVELTEVNNFCPDIASYLEENHLRPKIVEVNYPNNPTGRSVDYGYFARLKKYLSGYGGILINDAAYLDYSYQHPPVSLLALGLENSIELYSASKTFGLTGLRVGLTAGDPLIIERLNSIRDQFNSGQALPFMRLYAELLTKRSVKSHLNRYKMRYQKLAPTLRSAGFAVGELDSTFYLFTPIPEYLKVLGSTPLEIAIELKRKHGIVFIPYEIEGRGYFRISLTYKNDGDIEELGKRLGALRG